VADSKKEVEDTDLVRLAEAYNKSAVTA